MVEKCPQKNTHHPGISEYDLFGNRAFIDGTENLNIKPSLTSYLVTDDPRLRISYTDFKREGSRKDKGKVYTALSTNQGLTERQEKTWNDFLLDLSRKMACSNYL